MPAMDDIKKQRPKKDIHEKNTERLLKWHARRANNEFTRIIRELSWPKYLAGATVVMAFALFLNLPLVRIIHHNSDLKVQVDEIMTKFMAKMDSDERRFQKNLLYKFRTEKQMQVKNVTSDDLKSSRFFDEACASGPVAGQPSE